MEPTSEREAALANLEAIRDVLDRTTRYTQISSTGIVLGGVCALLAGLVGIAFEIRAVDLASPAGFLLLWGGAFVAAIALGTWTTARRARRTTEPLWNRKLQFVLLRFAPCLVLGAVLTAGLAHAGRVEILPSVWLGLYGVGILSVSMVLDWEFQLTGWSFVVTSTAALFLLRGHPHVALMIGFGGVHVALGTYRLLKEYQWQKARRSHSFRS